MSLALPAPRPLPTRALAILGLALASALGLAPTISRIAAVPSHVPVCRCAQCPGGAHCCCAKNALKTCPTNP